MGIQSANRAQCVLIAVGEMRSTVELSDGTRCAVRTEQLKLAREAAAEDQIPEWELQKRRRSRERVQ